MKLSILIILFLSFSLGIVFAENPLWTSPPSPSPIPGLSPGTQPPSLDRPNDDQERPDHKCGIFFGDPPCDPGRCCSAYGWCGDTADYCEGSNCNYQCWDSSRLTTFPRALLRNNTNN